MGQARQGETVLIVDDEPSVRMLVTEVLEDLGYTAIEASDSVAGLKVLQSDVRIDLLVTGLPGYRRLGFSRCSPSRLRCCPSEPG